MCNTAFGHAVHGRSARQAAPVHHRPVVAADFDALRARSEAGALCTHVLQPRFGTFENFFLEALNEPMRRAFYLSLDDQERLLGWACCFRYHEREGYAGTVQWVVEIGATPLERQAAAELLSLCLGASQALGLTTLVAMLHSAMTHAIDWHAQHGFDSCGGVDMTRGHRLHVLSRRVG